MTLFFPDIRKKEQIVNNVLLVAFKNTLLEEYNYYTDFDQEDDYSIVFGKENDNPLDLEPGPHYFYAFANLPDDLYNIAMSVLQGGESLLTKDEFERIIISKSLDYLTGDGNLFIMTNTTSPEIRGIYSQKQIEDSNGLLHNNVTIPIGRAVGKISFAYVADLVQTGELHGSLSNIRYKIFNNPRDMYLMPLIENNILITHHYNYTTYPANYFSPWIRNEADAKDRINGWLPATTTSSLNNNDELKYAYCIENHNEAPVKSTATMLLIEAKFTPTVWLNADGTIDGTNPDGTKGTPNSNGTFYRIGHYNSQGILYAYLPGYYNEEPTGILADLGTPTAGLGGGKYQIDEYKEGVTYYGFWSGYDDLHQVKRNNYYKIAITHVHGAGYTEPGGPVDPDIDPDADKAYGRLAVNIESWIDEKVIVTLGQEPEENPDINTGIEDWNEEDQEENLGSGDENKFN
ncbi:MAG: Mfa1 family fimbria major subunit [Tannerellaceae bacterium]|nr:Mfa1 family fimbria major subunit [Tannerellaceae bacterium]